MNIPVLSDDSSRKESCTSYFNMWHPRLPFFWVTLQLWIDYGTPVSITLENDSNFFERNGDTFVENETGAITGIVEPNVARQTDRGALKIQHSLRPVFLEKLESSEIGENVTYCWVRSRWGMQHLSYTISKYPRRTQLLGGKKRVDEVFERAFGIWENASALTFIRTTTRWPDIDIPFDSGWHNWFCKPFDGQNGVLAHASSPRHGAHIHFDDDEIWTVDSYDGINLLQVAVHEAGHAIGIDHSEVAASAMAPRYRSYNPNFELDADDVEAVRALYEKMLPSTDDSQEDALPIIITVVVGCLFNGFADYWANL
ncbi:Macrophage metalloelastase [Orchesella cincta]|uniref:Macrophage metalloelastase n=1 Tax=Orchesella cincta TaxID=48709 RepID=A0A1D2M5S2_ORCCI|nr:Macrophage metalloelastase [Orchesella cincta]